MTLKLLVAIHPGYTSEPALERARELSQACDVDLLLYCALYDARLTSLRTGELQGMKDAMVASEENKLQSLASELAGVAKSVAFKAEWQYPIAASIEAAADEFGADIILASTIHHAAISRIWLTNTDWSLVREAKRPVLFAHPTPFRPYANVLAAVDPTHTHDEPADLDRRIIQAGNLLAGPYEGDVHLGHAYPSGNTIVSPEYVVAPEVTAEWLHQHSLAVQALAEKHGISEDRVHLIDESPLIAIPHMAEEISASLVVVGALSRSFLERAVVGHVTEQLLDRLECDVLTVPGRQVKG